MFNFDNIVNNLLIEAEGIVPSWYKEVIAAYNNKNQSIQLSTGLPKPGEPLFKALNVGISSNPAPSPNEYDVKLAPLVDLFRRIRSTDTKGINASDVITFINAVESYINTGANKSECLKVITEWKNSDLDYSIYSPVNKSIIASEAKRTADTNKLASTAYTTIENLCILPAVQDIVKKRTDIVKRVLALKNPSQPFTTLLYNIFNKTAQYASGNLPITSDFAELVEGNLHIRDIILIAIYARELYDALIHPTTESGTPQPGPGTPPQLPGRPNQPQLPGGNTPELPEGDKYPLALRPDGTLELRPDAQIVTVGKDWDLIITKDLNFLAVFPDLTLAVIKSGVPPQMWRKIDQTLVQVEQFPLAVRYDGALLRVEHGVTPDNWEVLIPGLSNLKPSLPECYNIFNNIFGDLITEANVVDISKEIAAAVKRAVDVSKFSWIKDTAVDQGFIDFVTKGILPTKADNPEPGAPIPPSSTALSPERGEVLTPELGYSEYPKLTYGGKYPLAIRPDGQIVEINPQQSAQQWKVVLTAPANKQLKLPEPPEKLALPEPSKQLALPAPTQLNQSFSLQTYISNLLYEVDNIKDTKPDTIYNLKEISLIKEARAANEAKRLIDNIKRLCDYQKESPGVMQRMNSLGAAAQQGLNFAGAGNFLNAGPR